MKGANELEKTYDGLPLLCYGINDATDEVVILERGVSGYYPFNGGDVKGEENAEKLNAELGVTPAQAMAMKVGSMFGWNVPGANPANYDVDGNYIRLEEFDVEESTEEPEPTEYVALNTYAYALRFLFPNNAYDVPKGSDIHFAVFAGWLNDYLAEEDGRQLSDFLATHTYDDTERLFEKAIAEKKVVKTVVPAGFTLHL